MNLCFECGSKVSADDKFCSACGTMIIEADRKQGLKQESIKKCRECSEENLHVERKCTYCGAIFTGNEEIFLRDVPNKEEIINTSETKKIKIKKAVRSMSSVPETQGLETWKLASIIISAVIVGIFIIIIYADQNTIPEPSQNISTQPQQNPQIDLARFDEINQLERDIAQDNQNSEKLLRLANLTHDAGLFEKSIKTYEDYLKIKPGDTDARVDMGVCYFEQKNYSKAEEIFLAAIKQSPKHQIAHLNLGVVNLSKGEIEKAKDWLQKCIALGEHTDVGHRASELLKTH